MADIAGHGHLSRIEWRIAARKGTLKTMHEHDRAVESRQAGVRGKVEHPFLIVKRDFGFTKTRYRGIGKNLNHLHVLFDPRTGDASPRRRPHPGGGAAESLRPLPRTQHPVMESAEPGEDWRWCYLHHVTA